MRFISVREFRGKSGDVWKALVEEQELVITSNGKPIAIVSAVSEETLEDSLRAIRHARTMVAVDKTRCNASPRREGWDRTTSRRRSPRFVASAARPNEAE